MPCYFYLFQDKLARKIHLSDRFYVRVGRVGHVNSTALLKHIKKFLLSQDNIDDKTMQHHPEARWSTLLLNLLTCSDKDFVQ